MTALRASSLFNWQRGPLGDWGKSWAALTDAESMANDYDEIADELDVQETKTRHS